MAKFLALFTGEAAAAQPDEATVAKGIQAWGDWMTRHAGRIADGGGPLGRTKRISRSGIADVRNNLGAYVVVDAEDHEAAARMFEGHPHFTIFPGDGVEVMPLLPVPGS